MASDLEDKRDLSIISNRSGKDLGHMEIYSALTTSASMKLSAVPKSIKPAVDGGVGNALGFTMQLVLVGTVQVNRSGCAFPSGP